MSYGYNLELLDYVEYVVINGNINWILKSVRMFSTGCDGIPMDVLKHHLSYMIKPLGNVLNYHVKAVIFPDALKNTLV